MTPAQFREALAKLGVTQAEAARLLGYSLRTIERYAATGPIPKVVELALRHIRAHQPKDHTTEKA